MKKLLILTILFSLVLTVGCATQRQNSASSGGAAAQGATGDRAEALDRLTDSAKIMDEIMNAPDSAIPEAVLSQANCVAIVPSMIRGGFVIGGKHGRGVATCREQGRWSAPVFFTLSGGNWGPQIGVQSVDLVLLVMNDDGMKALLDNNLKLDGVASASAGPVGRTAQVGTDWKAESGVLAYSRSRGLFAGLTLEGAGIRPDDDSNQAFYGRPVNFRTALSGEVKAPAGAQEFLTSVGRHFRASRK